MKEKAFSFGIYNRAPQVGIINRNQWRCVETAIRRFAKFKNTPNSDISNIIEVDVDYKTKAPRANKESGEV